mgnify:CR=1 FL=1
MADNITNPVEVGEFIEVPAWSIEGMVVAIESAWTGSEHAKRLLLEAKPDDPSPRWYHLEPFEYVIVG